MIRVKHPFEYELIPNTIEKGIQRLTVRLKNRGDTDLRDLNVKMHSLDSVHISFRNPNHYIYHLKPDKEEILTFQADAYSTSHLYITVHGRRNGDHFHWLSPLVREQVLGDPAEIKRIFVSSPYGKVGGELEVEAVIKDLGDSNGLGLAFWTETPSYKYVELADMKTKKMSRGDETAYKAKIKLTEDGLYTVYVNLYDDYRTIDMAYDMLYVGS
jgi:hypothetical protein